MKLFFILLISTYGFGKQELPMNGSYVSLGHTLRTRISIILQAHSILYANNEALLILPRHVIEWRHIFELHIVFF